jgi:spore photoproduct lyase
VFSTIYIEAGITEHPRTKAICARFPRANQVFCERHGEVFNPKAQDFRLQKQKPALILANKHDNRVLKTPAGYGIGGERNYYFSHMLNCLYDCRYCFLQGMYRSANYVLFVNYEDFYSDIDGILENADGEPCWFFSGYDCDSLALEPVTAFAGQFLPFFASRPQAHIELRTKSTQVRSLLNQEPLPNAVVAFSFTPEEIHGTLEHKVPVIQRRIDSMCQLQHAGWSLGLRFDPLIYQPGYREYYRTLFQDVFSEIDAARLHSVSLGTFRLPRGYFKNILQLYPDEPLYAGSFAESGGMISYPEEQEREITGFCTAELLNHIPESLLFPCAVAA